MCPRQLVLTVSPRLIVFRTYPSRIYDIIFAYHAQNHGRLDRALDLGCGPGFVALNLAQKFQKIVGLDPAQKMVDIGLQPSDSAKPRIEYRVGSGEDLVGAGISQGEAGVDLVVAGEFWRETRRARLCWVPTELACSSSCSLVRLSESMETAHQGRSTWRNRSVYGRSIPDISDTGLTLVKGYSELLFPHHPALTPLITRYFTTDLAPYWQPGRKIVEGLLDQVPFPVKPSPPTSPSDLPDLDPEQGSPKPDNIHEPTLEALPGADELDSSSWDASSAIRLKTHPDGTPWLMTKMYTPKTLEGYLRTVSALHTYHERHPEDAEKKGKGPIDGDIVDRLVGHIEAGMRGEGKQADELDGEILAGWPLVLMMIKKK